MSTPLVDLIDKKLGASPGRKILVVEGDDDQAVYDKWLTRLAAPGAYAATLDLMKAGGKDGGKTPLLQGLRWYAANGGEPRVFGLADRDEWDGPTCAARLAELPQLRLNPGRHSVESYFCVPDEIVGGLTALHPAVDPQPLRDAAEAAREAYVCHWALLTTTDRIKVRMTEIDYPGHFSAAVPPPPDHEVRARFGLWSHTLDPAAAFSEFDDLRAASLAEPAAVQHRRCVWAKRFFDGVICPALNATPGVTQRSRRDWLTDLAEAGPVPADVEAILRPLLA